MTNSCSWEGIPTADINNIALKYWNGTWCSELYDWMVKYQNTKQSGLQVQELTDLWAFPNAHHNNEGCQCETVDADKMCQSMQHLTCQQWKEHAKVFKCTRNYSMGN